MNFYNKLMVIDNFIDEDYQEKIKLNNITTILE